MKEVLNDKYVVGGDQGRPRRAWVDGIAQVFGTDRRKADLYYEGGFVGGIATGQINTALKIGETIDWTDFPTFGGAGDKPADDRRRRDRRADRPTRASRNSSSS